MLQYKVLNRSSLYKAEQVFFMMDALCTAGETVAQSLKETESALFVLLKCGCVKFENGFKTVFWRHTIFYSEERANITIGIK